MIEGKKKLSQREMLSLVRMVSAQIANVLDLDELARQVTSLIRDTFHYYFVAIFTVKSGQEVLEYRDSAPQFTTWTPSFSIQVGEGIIGQVALHGEEIIANDVRKDAFYRELNILGETRSEVALPLKIKNKILGVLDVQSDKLNAFQDIDMLVLRSLADSIATAVENARLYSEVSHKVEQLDSISEVSSALTSILDEDALLAEVVRLLHTRMSYPEVHVYDVHTGRRKIFFRAGVCSEGPIASLPDIELDDPANLISQVAQNGETIIIRDFLRDTGPDSGLVAPHKDGSGIFVPIIFSSDVLGILYLHADRPGTFGEDDTFILSALADSIAIAMRNAYLYRAEQWRRKVAESMKEVAGVLTANTDLRQVLQIILEELEGTLPIDVSAIWLLDPSEQPAEDGQYSQLHLSAVRLSDTFSEYAQNKENFFTPQEIISSCNQSVVSSPWLHTALSNQNPLTRTEGSPYEPLGAILDFPENYSAIAAPLIVRNEPIGLLAFAHHTSGRYGHEAQNMVATFASYAAVAIENTQLYEAAHDQAWISTVLLQVAEATQSLDSLDELLTTMAQMSPTVIGIASCSIFLWDSSTATFTPAATFGLDTEIENLFDELWITLGDIEAFDKLYLNKVPVFLSHEKPGEKSSYAAAIFETVLNPSYSVALFPMISHGDVLGAFLITYQIDNDDLRPTGLAAAVDWNERFTLIQGIAHQTAVAVENIQLIRAQREEAYVSVALLQVAQSIVSLNDLDEIIESIVRLTPILIGVKRCAVMLWDSDAQYYTMVDSYGITKSDLEVLGRDFLENEFPLLDTVRTTNQIIYHLNREATEQPLSWPCIPPEEIQTASFQDKVFLRSQSSLFMAFPLAVKGTVLGIMLTQEMDFANSATLFQAREKRHEIAIGITQQASLAIQNSMLQREVVAREKLEREFQLAREIQQTFLPEKMPKIQGWDVAGSWYPARQVSGDFYDLISLPGDKIGMVIADVADKGLPAALFMTVIRTLIRATAQESDSPAKVLKRVNELLIPDAKHGMFVTIVYAMIDLKTGQVSYANAGHNPPLICRAGTRRLETLPRTGMALGVLDDMVITDQKKKLAPGDCLIFYTDGITESFSPGGDMFGVARLRRAITDPNVSNVEQSIKAIENSVNKFIEGQEYSDDLTVVALHRRQPVH